MIAQIDFIEGVVAASNGESENKQVGMIFLGSVLQVEMGGKGGESVIPCHSCAQKKKRNDCLLLLFFFFGLVRRLFGVAISQHTIAFGSCKKTLRMSMCFPTKTTERQVGCDQQTSVFPSPSPSFDIDVYLYVGNSNCSKRNEECLLACLLSLSCEQPTSRARTPAPIPRSWRLQSGTRNT